MPEFFLKERIYTDSNGFSELLRFYHDAVAYRNCVYQLRFEGVVWIDGNMSALLLSMIYKLRQENNLNFFVPFDDLGKDLGVLRRNGFTSHIANTQNKFGDNRQSTISLEVFGKMDVDRFVDYIEKDFLLHRGNFNLTYNLRGEYKQHYLEIFSNVDLHAETDYPIFTCGQYFPVQKELKFTLCDIGIGFLPKISAFTGGEVKTSLEAIKWAIDGHSTKSEETKGGLTLKKIFFYCVKNNGCLHIVTGDCYWAYQNGKIENHQILKPFVGTTIHLVLRY